MKLLIEDSFSITVERETKLSSIIEDSLDGIDFIWQLERKFDVPLPENITEETTINDLVKHIESIYASQTSNSHEEVLQR